MCLAYENENSFTTLKINDYLKEETFNNAFDVSAKSTLTKKEVPLSTVRFENLKFNKVKQIEEFLKEKLTSLIGTSKENGNTNLWVDDIVLIDNSFFETEQFTNLMLYILENKNDFNNRFSIHTNLKVKPINISTTLGTNLGAYDYDVTLNYDNGVEKNGFFEFYNLNNISNIIQNKQIEDVKLTIFLENGEVYTMFGYDNLNSLKDLNDKYNQNSNITIKELLGNNTYFYRTDGMNPSKNINSGNLEKIEQGNFSTDSKITSIIFSNTINNFNNEKLEFEFGLENYNNFTSAIKDKNEYTISLSLKMAVNIKNQIVVKIKDKYEIVEFECEVPKSQSMSYWTTDTYIKEVYIPAFITNIKTLYGSHPVKFLGYSNKLGISNEFNGLNSVEFMQNTKFFFEVV